VKEDSMDGFMIRKVVPIEVAAVVNALNKMWVDTFGNSVYGHTKESAISLRQEKYNKRVVEDITQQAEKEFLDTDTIWFAVMSLEKIIGVSKLVREKAGIELNSLFIEPEVRNRGIGEWLMNHSLAHTAVEKPVHLWVAEKNISAQNFYLKNGFNFIAGSTDNDNGGIKYLKMIRDYRSK
jgi:GNAT superfamily N-acetyltransferase